MKTVTIPKDLVLPIWVDFTYYFCEQPKSKDTFNDEQGLEFLKTFCNNGGKANFAILVSKVKKSLPAATYNEIKDNLLPSIYAGWKEFIYEQKELVDKLA